MSRRPEPAAVGQLAASLDDLLQHRARLGACVLLSSNAPLSFTRLKELLDETDGSLGANLRRLEDAGYVSARKEFVDRRPVTWYALTSRGQSALASHLRGLEGLIREARGTAAGSGRVRRMT